MLAPLDKGVPLSGTVAKESNRKAMQHLTGGTVHDILVKDGDVVKAGQVLVRMNRCRPSRRPTSRAGQYFTARATEARLLAERDGKQPAFPADCWRKKDDPRVMPT